MNTSSVTLRDRTICHDEVLHEVGYNPYYQHINGALGDPLPINGRHAINLASNNYLGLADDARIKEAYIEAIRRYGVSMCATPVAGGYTDLFEPAHDALAAFIGIESLLVYPSCYQANNGVFMALATRDDLILFDRGVHSSLLQGIAVVGCRMLPFAHNDMDALEYLLTHRNGHPHVFVVTESVFSTEGSIAPFAELYRLCLEHGATPVVDDSHGIGVLGAHGGGILEHAGITDFQGVYTSSLGKALANNCGVVGGARHLTHYLRYFSPHLVYSTAVAPCVLAGITRTLEILAVEAPERLARVYRYAARIRAALLEAGFAIVDGEAPINSIKGATPEMTIATAKALSEHGIVATPFVFPSVPKREGRVRMIAGANLHDETIERATRIIHAVGAARAVEVDTGTAFGDLAYTSLPAWRGVAA
jgi:7-keto-8-aminopelargonate synthetase-like enzyme